MEERHEQWMARHGRVYRDAEEKSRRFKIFKANVEFVDSFNAAGEHKYKLGANQFADLTNDEFRATYSGLRPSKLTAVQMNVTFKYENFTAAPASIDWRTEGAVTPVKNQGQCGEQIIPIHSQILFHVPS